jgi:Zn-dependent protease
VFENQPAPRPVNEAQYLPPSQRPDSSGTWKGIGAGGIGLGLLFLKFKTFLLVALGSLKFLFVGKILLSGLTFFASVWFYALFWGWKFALIFTILILVHELGHAAFMRFYGVPASLPYFIPGMGALISMKGRPASVLEEAYIALAGPLVGTLGALACYAYGAATGAPFWIAAAYTGFFINLFNLFPVVPLDGGRVVGAISPRVWIFGLIAMIVAAIAFHWWNPLMIILVVMSVPQAIAAWRGQLDPAYHTLTMPQRGGVALAYFGLAGFLFAAMLASRIAVPG